MNRYLFRALNQIQGAAIVPSPVRRWLRSLMGLKIDRSVGIGEGVYFGSDKIGVAAGSFINVRCFLDGAGTVAIGRNVALGPDVKVLTGTHAVGGADRRAGAASAYGVTIKDGAWIGAGSIIMPGITIAEGCVIGAGSVVTKDTDRDGVYVGSPAKRTKDL